MKKILPLFIFFVFVVFSSIQAQRGKDGAKIITTAPALINEFTSLTANAASGATSITVANSAMNTGGVIASALAAGDLVMIIQMQGASIKGNVNDNTWGDITGYNNSGLYEFREVLSVPNATTINLTCPLANNYTSSGKTQVVRVPRYTSLTINSGGILTTVAWNGTTGGIVTAEVLGNILVNAGGQVDVTGKGFRGGIQDNQSVMPGPAIFGSNTTGEGAEKGEGIAGFGADYTASGRYGRGAPANGGGGGNAHNAGGGGGSNAGTTPWNGNGNPDISTASWANAWNLEGAGFANSTSSGGGRGGYSYNSASLDPLVVAPGSTTWGGDNRQNVGGKGGRPLNYSGGRIFLGGGGGAGNSNDGNGTPGAAGGGLVYFTAYGSIGGSGSIIANGANTVAMGGSSSPCVVGGACSQPGCSFMSTSNGVCTCMACGGGGGNGIDAAGGAGGGGTIILNALNGANGVTSTANGGKGGDQNTSSTSEAEGPGGGGGGGYIAISSGTITTSVKGGNNGTTNAAQMTKFIPNGATKGGDGLIGTVSLGLIQVIGDTVCVNTAAVLNVKTLGTIPAGTTYTWYDAGGNVVGTGTSFTTPPLTATTIYYMTACPFAYRLPDTAYVKPCGVNVTATSAVVCNGVCATVTASASEGTPPYTYSWNTGATTSVLSACPTVTTTYTITVNDAGAKSATATSVITVNPVPVVVVPSVTICEGTSANLTASGATTYTWVPATGISATTGSSVTANPTTTTTYTVTGSFATGCTGVTTVVVTVNPKPAVTVPPATICQGNSTTLTATGSTTYTWSPGTGLSSTTGSMVTASPAATTTYTVTGSFATGCTASGTVVVTVNPPCGPGVAATGVTVCNGVCGTVTSTATGGVPPYNYSWNTGATTASLSPVPCPTVTTTYTITVTDNSVPVGSATAIAVITVNPNPVVTANDATICAGASATLTANGATTYSWAPVTGLSSGTGTSVTANPTTSTTYTVTGSFSTGCTSTTEVIVNVNPIPVVSVPNASICPGGSTVLNATGATTYTWSPGTGLSAVTGASVTANPSATTTYTVIGTSLGCSSSTTVTVSVGALVADAGPDKFICYGASTTLNAAGGSIFTWTPATGLSNTAISNPTANPTATTTYTVTVSDGFCSDDDVVIVTVNPPVSLNVAPVNVTCFGACNGQTIVIPSGGISPYTYAWSSGCTQAACNNVCAGTYTLTATDAMGCTASGSATVTEPAALTVALTGFTNVTCFGLCNGASGVSAAGGTPNYSYAWTPGGGAAATATALCAGTFTCTVTDANNCSVKTSVTITQPTPVIVSSAGTSICPNGSATLNASATGGSGAISFAWSPATGLSSTAGTSVVASPASTTVYTITGTDANGCTGNTSVTVTVNPAPVLSVPAATICEGTSIMLTASGANSYSWSPATGLSNPVSASPVAGPAVTTTYTVVGTSVNGCTGSTTVVVTVNPIPIVTAAGGNACPGNPISLSASGAISYSWSPVYGLSPVTGSTVTATIGSTTTYTITGTSANGCTATAIAIATVNPKPNAAFTTSPEKIDIFDPTAYFTDQSSGGIITSWNWSLGDINNSGSTLQNPRFTYPAVIDNYTVQLIVTNQYGCMDTTTGIVYIRGIYTFFIPNTFTPNNDGTNDVFLPKGVGIDETDYDLWIFDRWGNLIWHTSIWGEAWDGKANGGADVAQIDTYVWKVHVREKESQIKHNYVGHVNIVK